MSKIVIREAKPTIEEGLIYARFFDEAAEGLFEFILGKQAYELIAQAYIKPDNSYSYQYVSFAESGSEIIGMVSGYSMLDSRGFSSQSLQAIVDKNTFRLWIFTLVEIFFLYCLTPKKEGEFYIQAVAVDEKRRGLGIGRSIMEHIEGRAKERGSLTLSLDVSSKNKIAIALYDKQEFHRESFWPNSRRFNILTRMTKVL